MTDYTKLEIGTEIVYTGDRANAMAFGKIVGERCDQEGGVVYEIDYPPANVIAAPFDCKLVSASAFTGSGRRFMLRSEWKADRKAKMQRIGEAAFRSREWTNKQPAPESDGEEQPITEAVVFQVETLMAELDKRGHTTKWAIGRDATGDRCVVFEVDGITKFHYPVSFFAGYADTGLTVNVEHEANTVEADMAKAAVVVGAAAQLEATDDDAEVEAEFKVEAQQEAEAEDDAETSGGGIHLVDLLQLCEGYAHLGSSIQQQLRQLAETGPGDQNPNACALIVPWLKSVDSMFQCEDASFLVEDVIAAIDDANYVIAAGKAKEEHVTGSE